MSQINRWTLEPLLVALPLLTAFVVIPLVFLQLFLQAVLPQSLATAIASAIGILVFIAMIFGWRRLTANRSRS